MNKMRKIFKNFFKFIDKRIITPFTKIFVFIAEKTKNNGKSFEKMLTKKSSLVFISLTLSLVLFFFVDTKSIILLETSADVIYNQKVNAIYNEEAYVIEGLPEYVDITLIGRKSDLYLAKQLPAHEVAIDLKDLRPGTHRVTLKYKGAIERINYKLDPSIASVTIYPKVSEVRTVNVDILNKDNLDSRLSIAKVDVERQDVIIKGAEYKLAKVSVVKALLDINSISNPSVGEVEVKDIPLVAYDQTGNVIDIEIVPSRLSANVTIESPSKIVPIRLIPTGTPAFGKAIDSISADFQNITIYGDQESLEKISYIPVEIDVEGLSDKKRVTTTIRRPQGIRHINQTRIVVDVSVGEETTLELEGIKIEHVNLSDKYIVYAMSERDMLVDIVVKGVEDVIKDLDPSNIKVFVDLSGYGPGRHEVDVVVEGTDPRITYLPKVRKINLVINEK